MPSLLIALATVLIQAVGVDEQLLEAARKGDLAAVESLVEKGASIEAQSRYGQTPLFFAARNSLAGAVKHLLGKGAKVEVRGLVLQGVAGWRRG